MRGLSLITQDNHFVLNGGLYPPTERQTSPGAEVLEIENFRLSGTVFLATVCKRFALCYRIVVCPVCLSLCDVGVMWPNSRKLDMQIGLGPGHIVLDWDPAPPQKRGTAPSPFSAHVRCRKRLDRLRCHLVWM